MSEVSVEEQEFRDLDAQFRKFIEVKRRTWLSQNRPNFINVFELLTQSELEKVETTRQKWSKYITSLAEAWWLKHGYKIIWPDNNADPVQYQKLEE